MRATKYYALYKGDQIVSHGTKWEIIEKTGLTMDYMNHLASRTKRGLQKSDSTQLIEVEGIK